MISVKKELFEPIEKAQLKPKVNHNFKLNGEIESIRIENNALILEGYCFLQKVDNKRVRNLKFLLVDTSYRNRKVLALNNVQNPLRPDVTYIHSAENKDNYDYSGFRLTLDLNQVGTIKIYKRLILKVLINVDKRNIILPLTKIHSSLEKNNLLQIQNLKLEHKKNIYFVFNEEKVISKQLEKVRDDIYLNSKNLYKKMPKGFKTDIIRNLMVYCKKKLLS